jgi:hypothetical protein
MVPTTYLRLLRLRLALGSLHQLAHHAAHLVLQAAQVLVARADHVDRDLEVVARSLEQAEVALGLRGARMS